jgi:cysteine desulfurase
VLDTCSHLEKLGAEISYLDVDKQGLIDPDELNRNITDRTILVSVMMANNETGVIQPMQQISKIVHDKGCLFMSDATQAAGKIPVDVNIDGIDLLSLSAHKLYGPKGIGALYVRRKNPRVKVIAQIDGGGHENGLRSGTINVPATVGFGHACRIAKEELWTDAARISNLRTLLEQNLTTNDKRQTSNDFHIVINGSIKDRLPNTTNLSFGGIKADRFIKELRNIAVATGSACTSAIPEPSHVLKAMGIPDEMAFSSIRFSLGKYTTEEEIKTCIEEINQLLEKTG